MFVCILVCKRTNCGKILPQIIFSFVWMDFISNTFLYISQCTLYRKCTLHQKVFELDLKVNLIYLLVFFIQVVLFFNFFCVHMTV